MKTYLLNIICGIIICLPSYSQNLISVVPAAGTQGQTLTVNISGQNTSFGQGSSTTSLWFSQGSSTLIYPNSTFINGSANMDAEFTFSYSHPTGYYDVNVYNSLDGNMTLFSGFLLNTGSNPPQIIVVDPDSAYQEQTLTVSISGQNTNFGQGSSTTTLWFSQGSSTLIYPNSILINNSTNIDAEFTFSYSHPTGYYDVNVYNSLDGYMALFSGFLLNTGLNPPQIIVVDPDSAYRGQTLMVNISGQNTYFGQGSSTTFVWFNQGSSTIYADLVNPISITELIAGFIIPNDAALGFWDVNVYDPTNGIITLNNGFRIDSLGTGIEIESIDGKIMFGFYPNPFKEQIKISYDLKEPAAVLLEVYDGSGKIVKTIINENQLRGSYLLKEDFEGLGLKSGLYFIRLNAGDNELIMKIMKL